MQKSSNQPGFWWVLDWLIYTQKLWQLTGISQKKHCPWKMNITDVCVEGSSLVTMMERIYTGVN